MLAEVVVAYEVQLWKEEQETNVLLKNQFYIWYFPRIVFKYHWYDVVMNKTIQEKKNDSIKELNSKIEELSKNKQDMIAKCKSKLKEKTKKLNASRIKLGKILLVLVQVLTFRPWSQNCNTVRSSAT